MRHLVPAVLVTFGVLAAAACGGGAKPADSPAGAGYTAGSSAPPDPSSDSPAGMSGSPKGAEPEAAPKP